MSKNPHNPLTQALALTRPKSPCIKKERSPSPPPNRNSSGHSSPTHHHQQPNKNLSGHQSSLKTSPIPIVNENGLTPSSCRNTPIPLAMTPKISENGLHHHQHHQQQSQHTDKILQSPSIDRRDFDMSKVNSKSLPLHCVVESVHSLQASLNIDSRSPFKRRPTIETDSYVIIAASTQWSDIVTTALQKLGYSNEVANTARGSLIIKNWKPISLEDICENPVVQVSEILGELTTIVTLRIVILRSKTTPFSEIKDKLLKLLVLQSHAVLRSTGCPLDEVTLSQICRSPYQNTYSYPGCEISDDTKRKFDQWWNTQLSPQAQLTSKILPFITPPSGGQHDELEFSSQAAAAAAAAHAIASHHQSGLDNHHHQNQSAVPTTPTHPNPMLVHPALHSMHSHHHHHSGQFGNQKTRMRTSFDPEMELPKLQKWFQENPHPSRQQIQTYVVQLNSLESRRGRKPLDVNNVVYWFKNARAAQKRAEIRGGLGGNGYFPHPNSQQNQQHHQSSQHVNNSMHMSTHDFLKSPISLKSEDIDDNISQHSDDLDEDNSCSRPSSPPQLPLSLTIHERNRSEDDSSVKDELSVNGGHEGSNELSSTKNDIGSMNTNSSCHNSNHEDEVSRCGDNENNVSSHNQDGEHNLDEHNNNNSSNNNNNVDEKSNENSPKNSSKSEEDLDMDDNSQMMDDGYRSPSPDPRRELPFPMVPNSMLQHSFMYMSHYMPGAMAAAQAPHHPHNPNMTPVGVPAGLNLTNLSSEERRKRNRTFIDPVTEVPKLEQWFAMNTHPSHNLILKYTEDLNRMPYRQKFPRLESKNVQFWFKNRRAKCKRLKMSLYDGPQCSQLGSLNPYAHHKYEERD
ncbi:dve-1 family protein [Megaselia abdita]